jgi:hypothetical protein
LVFLSYQPHPQVGHLAIAGPIKGNRASHFVQRNSRSKRSSLADGPQRGQTPRRIAACHSALRSSQFLP